MNVGTENLASSGMDVGTENLASSGMDVGTENLASSGTDDGTDLTQRQVSGLALLHTPPLEEGYEGCVPTPREEREHTAAER